MTRHRLLLSYKPLLLFLVLLLPLLVARHRHRDLTNHRFLKAETAPVRQPISQRTATSLISPVCRSIMGHRPVGMVMVMDIRLGTHILIGRRTNSMAWATGIALGGVGLRRVVRLARDDNAVASLAPPRARRETSPMGKTPVLPR